MVDNCILDTPFNVNGNPGGKRVHDRYPPYPAKSTANRLTLGESKVGALTTVGVVRAKLGHLPLWVW